VKLESFTERFARMAQEFAEVDALIRSFWIVPNSLMPKSVSGSKQSGIMFFHSVDDLLLCWTLNYDHELDVTVFVSIQTAGNNDNAITVAHKGSETEWMTLRRNMKKIPGAHAAFPKLKTSFTSAREAHNVVRQLAKFITDYHEKRAARKPAKRSRKK